MASDNEARIRDKTEAALRAKYPRARIIHELVLEQGTIRIDLAAICESRIIVAEIKSEKDTLKRVKAQITRSTSLACETWLVANEKHIPEIELMLLYQYQGGTDPDLANLCRCWVNVYIEREGRHNFELFNHSLKKPPLLNGAHIFDLLWSGEMADMLRGFGLLRPVKAHPPRYEMTYIALENLSLKQIRAGVCQALRRRQFARADKPMEINQ